MDIGIQNCNNILNGTVNIVEGALNIKYAINGTGKSTIAKAILAASQHDDAKLKNLKPYCYMVDGDEHIVSVSGIDTIKKVMIFDESYINQYVYQPGELLKNSFEIFVKTPDYDRHMEQIQILLSEIGNAFQTNPELDEMISAFSQFLDGCGKSQSGLAASGSIVKGLGKGNKLNNIPEGLEVFRPYLSNTHEAGNVKWLKWQADGRKYLDMAEQCPYCSGSVEHTKEKILKIAEEYDSKAIEHLDKMLSLFAQLEPYFSENTILQIAAITDNAGNMSTQQKNYIFEVKQQVATVFEQLTSLKMLGFQTLKDTERVADKIKNYKIDLELFSHLQSERMREKVFAINKSLDGVLEKAGRLQGEVNQQNNLIRRTIEENSSSINEFLQCAGYEYIVSIEESDNHSYRMILKPTGYETEIASVREHLSFGERNALALALFMYSAIKEDPDLIVLDDPISSFDGNKKFAIINMLFLAKKSLKNKTVLLLTHEFSTVIDVIYTMPQNFNPNPVAAFLTIKKGILNEQAITKSDISSYNTISKKNISEGIDNLNRAIYLRRFIETTEGKNNLVWNLLSSLFHKREKPTIQENGKQELMSEEEKEAATQEIKNYISDFDYSVEYKKTQDNKELKSLYDSSKCNYEKLQIYRIIFNENKDNPVIRKFINETFHVENDYLFQLNPRKYDTVPQYIIDECDKDIESLL